MTWNQIFRFNMQDDFDRASDLEEQYRTAAIKHVRDNDTNYKSVGFCLNCGAKSKKRFCDLDCRNDYEKRTK
jgi:hypothetical protein